MGKRDTTWNISYFISRFSLHFMFLDRVHFCKAYKIVVILNCVCIIVRVHILIKMMSCNILLLHLAY